MVSDSNLFYLLVSGLNTSFLSPGRFFAVNVMKALIAHIIVTYDFKFEDGEGHPDERRTGLFRTPGNADLLFRKRRK